MNKYQILHAADIRYLFTFHSVGNRRLAHSIHLSDWYFIIQIKKIRHPHGIQS